MSVQLKTIISLIEEHIPLSLAEDWDNCGLQIGREDKAVKKIGFALDPDEQVIDMAIADGVDLVITHHPLLLSGIKNLVYSENTGRIIIKAIKNDIAVYSLHTNLDSIKGGLNDFFIEKIGYPLKDAIRSYPLLPDPHHEGSGVGRIVEFKEPVSSGDLALLIKEKLNLSSVFLAGDSEMVTDRAALCTGSGMSLIKAVQRSGVSLYITGDTKYHDTKDAVEKGICIIDVGHFGSEIIACDLLHDKLNHIISENDIDAELVLLKTDDVFKLI